MKWLFSLHLMSVVSLRAALDSSREELRRLKKSVGDFNGESYLDTVQRLALENHVLRRRILDKRNKSPSDTDAVSIASKSEVKKRCTNPAAEESGKPHSTEINETVNMDPVKEDAENESASESVIPTAGCDEVAGGAQGAEVEEEKVRDTCKETEVLPTGNPTELADREQEDSSLKSVSDGENSVFGDNPEQFDNGNPEMNSDNPLGSKPSGESENDSEELDDIELIFTTDDTREVSLQEDLVSITEGDTWPSLRHRQFDGQPVLLKYTKTADPEALLNGDKTSSSVDEAVSSQSSSIDREESVDRFDEGSGARLNKMWSQCSVLVETDISKCGVLEEPDPTRYAGRRNTLAAPPTAYRPIIHREALATGRRKSATPLRPVMDRSGGGSRRESGAQTDISALPAQWRSESYLAHKVAHAFTTLPSKFALPAGIPGRLRLSDKTREARRVMLSDISFTSMVPELSRSADHLCHDPHAQTCLNARGCGPRTPEVHRRESLNSLGGYWPRCHPGTSLPSPCDCRLSTDLYSSRYRGSLTSIPSPGLEVTVGSSRRHSWRATAASFDTWRIPVATSTPRPTWSSMPSSPTHVHPPNVPGVSSSRYPAKNPPKRTRSKVTFKDCPVTRGSLPNLRSDSIGADNSGDSTESLIDEAEDYLRRSIDSMLTITGSEYFNGQGSTRRRRTRRHSEPDLLREWNPPQDARPYLPKIPRDLKLNHLVKVISPEGRVLQGRVRYVGPVPGREEPHVGVELPSDSGSSDGTFHGRRFFDCDPERAVFVPFKKVVLAWCTT
ncbi:uncharacterized protein LOC105683220 isoform X2 [Athalia rosae]|uniref:uncharacterized protein LOC105683220 isoform X2 n=1 Tax=Athalia rosae TaxID=37344 RepID=UPI00203456C9|nr:uncharacterized protein LOC105683220 isoform X2 [Athalia rosae]